MSEKRSSLASVMLARDAAPSQTGDGTVTALREHLNADDILFAKGAATAAGFNPHHRSYDYRPGPPPTAAMNASARRSPQAAVQPFQAAVIAFGCITLLLSAGLFLGSRSAGPGDAARAPAIVAPPTVAAAPAPEAPALEAPRAEMPATADAEDLVARGSELLGNGDIAAARLFFERAAEAGNAHAALFVGRTFDPAYLERAGVRGMRGDLDEAAVWYRRARDLGESDAQRYLDNLAARRILEAPAPD